MSWLWTRLGDSGEYEKFDAISEFADELFEVMSLNDDLDVITTMFNTMRQYETPKGFEMFKFTGQNYISLYWGDDEAQPTREITKDEFLELQATVFKMIVNEYPQVKVNLKTASMKYYLDVSTANLMRCKPEHFETKTEAKKRMKELKQQGYVVSLFERTDAGTLRFV